MLALCASLRLAIIQGNLIGTGSAGQVKTAKGETGVNSLSLGLR